MRSIESILNVTLSAAAVRAGLKNPLSAPAARRSQAMDEQTWSEQVAAKLAVAEARKLVARPLSDTQLDHVLTVESRAGVIRNAVSYTVPTREQLCRLSGLGYDQPLKSFTRALSDEVLVTQYGDQLDVDWLRHAAGVVGGLARLQWWLSAPAEVTDQQVVADLVCYETWGPKRDGGRLAELFAARPGALVAAGETDSLSVRTAAAGSRHLLDPDLQRQISQIDQVPTDRYALKGWIAERRFMLMALVNNPTCDLALILELMPHLASSEDWELSDSTRRRLDRYPYGVGVAYEHITDATQLTWVLRRTAPSEHKPAGRPYDAAAVLANPNIGPGAAADFTKHLPSMSPYDRTRIVRRLRPQLEDLADRFPDVMGERNLSRPEIDEMLAEPPVVRPVHEDEKWCGPATDALRKERVTLAETAAANLRPDSRPVQESMTVASLASSHWASQGVEYLEQALGEKEHNWVTLFDLLGNGVTGTLDELVVATLALASEGP